MLDSSQQWQLFGYDSSQLGRRWLAAWRDFLFGDDSPLRSRLDEVVALRDEQGLRYFHCDREVPAAPVDCGAILLPDALALGRRLQVPLAAESELDSVMALEVQANSPFPAGDTGYGWKILQRDERNLQVLLVIASLSSTMRYLGQRFDCHDPAAQEVWAEVDGRRVTLRGFGEARRERRYRRRLLRVAGLACGAALLLLAILAVAAGAKYRELQQLETMYEQVKAQAADASRMRSALAAANSTIAEVDALLRSMPSPHPELARLTALLGDDTYLTDFNMQGSDITLRGRAANAADVMRLLADQPRYAQVAAPDAFRVQPGSGMEEFHLRISLAAGAGQ